MASNNDFLTYVLELLREVSDITYKKMMGEYILYKDGKIFGGIYDNRFLVKKVAGLEKYHMKEQAPYPTARAMLLVDAEDPEVIDEIVKIIVKN